MNHPVSQARGGFCIVPNELIHHASLDDTNVRGRTRTAVMGCEFDLGEEPPKAMHKLCNVSNSYLKTSVSKMDRTIEGDDYSSEEHSPLGRNRGCSMGASPEAEASPTSVTIFVDKETAKNLPLLPCITETSSGSKRVRFQVDENGEIDEDVSSRSFPMHALTPDDIKVCWYNRKERSQLKSNIPSECRVCVLNHPEYCRAAMKVCAMASRREYASLLNDNLDALHVVVNGEARGLERYLFHRMNLPRKSCKTNVHAVLRTQKLIRELPAATYSDEAVATLIAEQYHVNAQYAKRWSLVLAEGDAIDARAYSDAC